MKKRLAGDLSMVNVDDQLLKAASSSRLNSPGLEFAMGAFVLRFSRDRLGVPRYIKRAL